MQMDSQQQPHDTASDRGQDMHSMQTPDLTPREGVGRCYYTQMPRLVKVSKACMVATILWQCILLMWALHAQCVASVLLFSL